MPRQARLDAPGALHHVMGRGIEGTSIFLTNKDREDFLTRLGALCEGELLSIHAWALLDNHFHLLIRTGKQSLSEGMRKLLTGYVVSFNHRYGRYGHLFQNRYKSILCEQDPYLLELTRYIHLNPIRAGVVKTMRGLAGYPWTGHGVIMGRLKRQWQEVNTVLSYFGKSRKEAIRKYERYVAEGVEMGKRLELVGGGLIRSMGGWSEVVSLRRRGEREVSDERILGGGEFVERMLEEAEERIKETLRWRKRVMDLKGLLREVAKREDLEEEEIRGRSRRKLVVRGRKVFCQVALRKLGYTGASVARFLGMTTSS
ncbi:MAG: transposase, partial [Syntrophaceae bacterium]|nr:transposase [Syntrophaceae bacterium]